MKNMNTLPTHLICFSHLRWDFVFQRPQHLLSRFAKHTMVYFFEEPVFDSHTENYLSVSKKADKLTVVTPHLCTDVKAIDVNSTLAILLDKFFLGTKLDNWIFWYYTPMAYAFSSKYKPKLIIYDCMDELSAFKFAPKELVGLEKKLMSKADLVFTGGQSLYESKKKQHANIFPFPSSIERKHFAQARIQKEQPIDQADIPEPRIGFFGVIDERLDIELIRDIANQRPDWQLILIGPVVKISPDTLPKNKNIHYLGQKSYAELPAYLSGWDVALIPFQLNESTRFISPTKTPEYLAAGVPVVSTPIKDVINPYGLKKLVHIGSTSADFIRAIEKELKDAKNKKWMSEVDKFLKDLSWDKTHAEMIKHIEATLKNLNTILVAS